ncbi:DUF559 domain-containing protein [Nocardioides sp. zg-536]|uniref:DUF559 domain-containing protein n=1 Tax=Nocardioides faecalis TaxID=2803858 RepID=A0A938Y5M5_9ACTN|nr:DUF559 domain-containing protein [Nocardioides faecalis]MBM9459644.1 DUF559 domain-containing protein [Nocardioides faecalis]QVI58169.1 DUF559 domain-containing protein [Nocardioides faecalis]
MSSSRSQATAPPALPSTPVTAGHLRELGITRSTLRRMVREGVVRHVTRDVYVAADLEDSVELRCRAIARVVRPHQVVCDRTAAWLWGVDAFAYGELDDPPIETAALRGSTPCRRAAVQGHTRDLSPDDVCTVAGVRLTTPLRTALDLGCTLHRREALAALDAFRRLHGLSLGLLSTACTRYARRRGVVQLRELIALSDPLAESARESWTRLAILDAGLPAPELQVWVHVDGVPRYRLDLAYRRRRVAIEYDGWEAHHRDPEQREHDDERRRWLREQGWTVVVVRAGDFTGAGLDRWLAALREALGTSYSSRRRLERGRSVA